MVSEKKKRKLKNSHFIKSMLKNTKIKIKGGLFFTSSQRKKNKDILNETVF